MAFLHRLCPCMPLVDLAPHFVTGYQMKNHVADIVSGIVLHESAPIGVHLFGCLPSERLHVNFRDCLSLKTSQMCKDGGDPKDYACMYESLMHQPLMITVR